MTDGSVGRERGDGERRSVPNSVCGTKPTVPKSICGTKPTVPKSTSRGARVARSTIARRSSASASRGFSDAAQGVFSTKCVLCCRMYSLVLNVFSSIYCVKNKKLLGAGHGGARATGVSVLAVGYDVVCDEGQGHAAEKGRRSGDWPATVAARQGKRWQES